MLKVSSIVRKTARPLAAAAVGVAAFASIGLAEPSLVASPAGAATVTTYSCPAGGTLVGKSCVELQTYSSEKPCADAGGVWVGGKKESANDCKVTFPATATTVPATIVYQTFTAEKSCAGAGGVWVGGSKPSKNDCKIVTPEVKSN